MTFLDCKQFKDEGELKAAERRMFDYISHESNSYFTKEHHVRVEVGDGTAALPAHAAEARLSAKRGQPDEIREEERHSDEEGQLGGI